MQQPSRTSNQQPRNLLKSIRLERSKLLSNKLSAIGVLRPLQRKDLILTQEKSEVRRVTRPTNSGDHQPFGRVKAPRTPHLLRRNTVTWKEQNTGNKKNATLERVFRPQKCEHGPLGVKELKAVHLSGTDLANYSRPLHTGSRLEPECNGTIVTPAIPSWGEIVQGVAISFSPSLSLQWRRYVSLSTPSVRDPFRGRPR